MRKSNEEYPITEDTVESVLSGLAGIPAESTDEELGKVTTGTPLDRVRNYIEEVRTARRYPNTVTGDAFAELDSNNTFTTASSDYAGYTTAPYTYGNAEARYINGSVTTESEKIDMDEVLIREKAIEATVKAFGFKEVSMEEFSNLLDYFYTYLKTGEKLKF